jgi:hypothetical protein
MAGARCNVVIVALLFVCVSYATARTLQQDAAAQDQSSDIAFQAPIQLGDGTERIIRAQSVRRSGGAVKAIGRAGLASLRTKSRFRGTLVDLARTIEHDDDIVSRFARATGFVQHVNHRQSRSPTSVVVQLVTCAFA